jgi:16S rRNA (guanine527-N7)-methyltransferase
VIVENSIGQILSSGATELGVELSDVQINSCLLYLSELKKWNQKINLTAIRDDRDIVIKHFLDSLSFIKGFAPVEGLKLLDMGSGAGFPALPLKIAIPGISVTMVESVKKKAAFIRHIIRTLRLSGAEVSDKRTEELPDSFHSSFDVVTARAFADMETALAAGKPFLKSKGAVVLGRGPEEKISEQELSKAGIVLERRVELILPHSDYKRAIWVFRKA